MENPAVFQHLQLQGPTCLLILFSQEEIPLRTIEAALYGWIMDASSSCSCGSCTAEKLVTYPRGVWSRSEAKICKAKLHESLICNRSYYDPLCMLNSCWHGICSTYLLWNGRASSTVTNSLGKLKNLKLHFNRTLSVTSKVLTVPGVMITFKFENRASGQIFESSIS